MTATKWIDLNGFFGSDGADKQVIYLIRPYRKYVNDLLSSFTGH